MWRLVTFLVLATLPLAAQEKPLRISEIRTFLDLGAESTEIIEFFEKESRRIEITADNLKELEREGADKDLLDWLRKQLPSPPPNELTAAVLIERHQAGASEEELLSLITAATKRAVPSLADALAMNGAGVPFRVMKAFRDSKSETETPPITRALTRDDLVKLAQLGVSGEDIVERIRTSDSQFVLDTGDLVDLKKQGVPLEVLREVNRRRLAATPTPVAETESEAEIESKDAGSEKVPAIRMANPTLTVHHDRSGYSILRPTKFADLAQFQGARSLLQLVDSAPTEGSLPEIEISVLGVLAAPNARERLVTSALKPAAERFTSDLRNSFRADGLELHAESPVDTWLAARPAIRIDTVTRAKDGRSYLGVHYLLFSEGRFHIVSYNVSSEKSAAWRPTLDRIVSSFTLEGRPLAPVTDQGDPRAAVESLFTRWRESLRQRDFRGWRSLHPSMADTVPNRQRWLKQIEELTGSRRRLELGRIDLAEKQLEYRRFGLDGPSTGNLGFLHQDGAWFLRHLP